MSFFFASTLASTMISSKAQATMIGIDGSRLIVYLFD
jgi:hypothetical protein